MKFLKLKNSIFYLKSSGVGLCVVSGCWLLYQIKRTSVLLNSVVPTNVLDLDNAQAQYIYVDNPKFNDIFMFQHKKDLQLSVKEKPRSLSYIVLKWWKSLNRSFAFHLFHVVQTGDEVERKRAIYYLSCLKYLKDWHYCQIAQMLDAPTAVALARLPGADLRFFLKPPYFHERHKINEIAEKLDEFFMALNKLCGGCHPCLLQFIHQKFKNKRDSLIFENDLTSVSLPVKASWGQDFLLNCVHAIHHHSSLDEHSKDVADVGGLQLLMDIYKIVGDDVDICSLMAKVLSNLSLYPEYLDDIFRSGWIGILAAWSRHHDLKLAAPASRALANLDSDDNSNEKYSQRIYPLYPLHRVSFKTKMDVVFIHGLLGGVFVTWRQRDMDSSSPLPLPEYKNETSHLSLKAIVEDHPSEFIKDLARDLEHRKWQKIGDDFEVVLHDLPTNLDNESSGPFFCNGSDQCMQQSQKDRRLQTHCWPKDWLPDDVPNLRIIGINYSSNLSMWTPLCPIEGVRSTIKERSKEFTQKLLRAGVGKRSTIWACHSMGGLLVKKMLVEEWKNGDKNNLLKNTKGIVFYSVPHRGSHVAVLNQVAKNLFWPSVEVQELREQSSQLLELHEDFLNMLREHNIDVISFGETKPTRFTALKVPFRIVNPNSADPGVGEFFEIPQDHIDICKPANRQSFLYQKVLDMVKRHVESSDSKQYGWSKYLSSSKEKLL